MQPFGKTHHPALYKQIRQEGILILPTVRHLKNPTSAFSVESGMSEATIQYLKARIATLSEREKVVNLIIDEVYSSQRIEYSGGNFYGYENQNVTKTLLCFMKVLPRTARALRAVKSNKK